MNYPDIDGVLISLGPLALRWYGLAYLGAFFMVWWLGKRRAQSETFAGSTPTVDQLSDLVFYGALGAILGGRLGYALFYGTGQLLADPMWLLRIWEGGMSFHGGLIGVCAALLWWQRRSALRFLESTDFVAPLVPIGLGLGRLGNFANTELPGRISESGIGFHYPCQAVWELNPACQGAFEVFVRHPSSLYQAFAEGLVLFAALWWYSSSPRKTGQVSAVFLITYGVLRLVTEVFREPDPWLGFLFGIGLTMGQCLSLAMLLAGALLYWHATKIQDA